MLLPQNLGIGDYFEDPKRESTEFKVLQCFCPKIWELAIILKLQNVNLRILGF